MRKIGFFLLSVLVLIVVGCSANTSGSGSTTPVPSNAPASVPATEAADASASKFPEKPIKLVIPYAPGGATDIIFRLAASIAEKELGQSIVPVNMPGANSTIGSKEVKDADPDGYTILASHDIIATANITGVVDYSFDAFAPIALLTQTPSVVAVHEDLNIKNMQEYKDYISANPQQLKMSMTPLSTDHFVAAMVLDKLGVTFDQIKPISYEGTGPQLTALVAKETDTGMFDVPSLKGLIEDGTAVPIGVTSSERIAALPDVPTMQEQGLDMTWSISRGLFAPKGTPTEVIVAIEKAFKKAMEDPELIKKLQDEQGTIVNFIPHEEYTVFLDKLQSDLEELGKTMDLEQ